MVTPSYLKKSQADAESYGHIRNTRGEAALSKTRPTTYESADNRRKRYVYCSTSESKTFLVHRPGHFSDECKVLGYFVTKYDKGNPNKDHGNHPVLRKKLIGSKKTMPLSTMWWVRFY